MQGVLSQKKTETSRALLAFSLLLLDAAVSWVQISPWPQAGKNLPHHLKREPKKQIKIKSVV
jgi:hypothetical protein